MCQLCKDGYMGDDCQTCDSTKHFVNAKDNAGADIAGQCVCDTGYIGADCQTCDSGYFENIDENDVKSCTSCLANCKACNDSNKCSILDLKYIH